MKGKKKDVIKLPDKKPLQQNTKYSEINFNIVNTQWLNGVTKELQHSTRQPIQAHTRSHTQLAE